MSIRLVTQCRVCQTIKKESRGGKTSKLQERIYRTYVANTRKFGEDSLSQIQRDYKHIFSYNSLRTHAINHQALTEDDLLAVKIQKVHQQSVVENVTKVVKHSDIRQTVMQIAEELLASRDPEFMKKLRPSDAIRAAKDQFDVEAKQTDQAMELQKMVWAFASEDVQARRKLASGSTDTADVNVS